MTAKRDIQRGCAFGGGGPFDAAKKMISRIAMNKWMIPRGVDPATYDPRGGEAV